MVAKVRAMPETEKKIEVGDLVSVQEKWEGPDSCFTTLGATPWTARVVELYKPDATELLVEPDPPLPLSVTRGHKRMALGSHDTVRLLLKGSESPIPNASLWDLIGHEFQALATARGGKHQLYKPAIRIEVYEHDDCVTLEVGRCKGMEEIVIQKDSISESYPLAILRLLREARTEAEKQV